MKNLFMTALSGWLSLAAFAQKSSNQLIINGLVEKSLTITVANITEFPVQKGKKISIKNDRGETRRQFGNYRGVKLRDLLDRAKVQVANHKTKGKLVVIASATDGYTVTFSYNELFFNPNGDHALVLFEENGQPLADDAGRFALVVTNDVVTGPRHVKWLSSVEVKTL